MRDGLLVAFSGYSRALYQPALERQLSDAGVPWLYCHDTAFSWRRRTLWQREVAAARPNHLIAFIDATDFLFFGDSDELAEKIESLGPVSFAAQKDCWPHPEKADRYRIRAPKTSPWCYLNSCGPAGRGRDIAAAIDYGWARYPIQTDEHRDTDTRFYTDLYLDGFGHLDQSCVLTQVMLFTKPGEVIVEDGRHGRIYNTVTRSWPSFMHVNWREPLPAGIVLPKVDEPERG